MIAVLSPAKRLRADVEPPGLPLGQPALLKDTQQLLRTTRRLKPADLAALMDLSDNLAQLNHERFQALAPPFTPDNALPAALTFAGDVYLGLEAETLDEPGLAFAEDHLRILSGLFGVLRPLDLIQPYRLEMGTRLKTRRGDDLYAFWGDRIAKQLKADLAAHEDRTLVNLASQEYFRAVEVKRLGAPVLTCEFREWKDGKLRMVSFFAKRARGLMARYLVDQRVDRAEGLKDFNTDGYAFDAERSTANTWVFTRPAA